MIFGPELIYIFELNFQPNEGITKIVVSVENNRYTTYLLIELHNAMPHYSANEI